jgi:2-isopropylmalate synthase
MFDHRKYRPAPTVQLPDRTWPDRTISRPRAGPASTCATATRRCGADERRAEAGAVALLVDIGIKEIEVGFPSASQPDYDFVRWLIEERQIPDDVTIQVLVQAREDLIERTFAALDGVPRAIVHVYNSTSPVQREWVFGADRDGVKAIAVRGAELLRRGGQVSGHRLDLPILAGELLADRAGVRRRGLQRRARCLAADAGAPVHPESAGDGGVREPERVRRPGGVVLPGLARRWPRASSSLHTHNDRGGAAAAAELGLLAGADRVEGTLLGNGERTGNMDLITVAMNLYSQGVDPRLDLSDPDRIIEVVETCTGMACHPRHPWVGELVYTAFSGSHQDAINKSLKRSSDAAGDELPWQVAYLPIDPATSAAATRP